VAASPTFVINIPRSNVTIAKPGCDNLYPFLEVDKLGDLGISPPPRPIAGLEVCLLLSTDIIS
jgi:hypothetical protein